MAVRIFDFLHDRWMRLDPKLQLAITLVVLAVAFVYAGWLEGTAPSGMYY